MAEARQLRAGRWRIYAGLELNLVRDPDTGAIVTFDSLEEARRWWWRRNPDDPPLDEAPKCARCGGYFGTTTRPTRYAGRNYHAPHTPQAVEVQRRR
jgi:hypothetical protein